LVTGLALALGGIGLRIAPGTSAWWLTRPIWILTLSVILLTLVPIFLRFERLRTQKNIAPIPTWRLLLGALLFCYGLASLTLNGIPADNFLGIRFAELAMPFIGAVLAGVVVFKKK
jgi:hypothetical protein